jgi:hypothetical protein
MADSTLGPQEVPPQTNAAVVAWMKNHGWDVAPARWEMDPEAGFHVWQEEEPPIGRSRALWVAESMVRLLTSDELVRVLNSEGVAEDLRISFKVRIEERGSEYRVSIVPRRSGDWRRQE